MKLLSAFLALGEASKIPSNSFNAVEIFQKVKNDHGITGDLPSRSAERNFQHAKGTVKANSSPEKALQFCQEHTGASDATVSLLGEGGQGVVYNCSSASLNFEAAEKLYRYPTTLDKERMRIVDKAMSDSGNGPIFFGSIEETVPPAYVNFYELLYGDSIDKIDELRPSDIDVYRAAAKRFASMHIISEEECPRPITNCYHAWPWNTRAIRSHYETATDPAKEWVEERIGQFPVQGEFLNISSAEGLIDFMYDVQWGTISPTVWCHNDAHDGNVFIRDAPEGTSMEERLMLIDYDNSEFGTRAFDLAYYIIRFYERFNKDIYEDFLNMYLREYNRISGVRQFSIKELEQEMTCVWPYLFMEQSVFYRSIGVDEDFCNFMFDVMRAMLDEYANGKASCPWTGRYSEFPKCKPPA